MSDSTNNSRKQYTEEFTVSGDAVLAKVKELIHEGNIRRLSIKNEEGRTLIEIPLTIGVIGTLLLRCHRRPGREADHQRRARRTGTRSYGRAGAGRRRADPAPGPLRVNV